MLYPNPIFAREKTAVLNGGWEFSFDNSEWQTINVPFCPQSKLSGIEFTDFIPVCYYKKSFTVAKTESRTILHFGAVDYRCIVYLNGRYVGMHVGGYTPFAFDITDFLSDEENELRLTVYDNERYIAFGKQSYKKNSFGCFYTRTTGIWQPVWLETVPKDHILDFYFYPNITDGTVDIDLSVVKEGSYQITVFFDGRKVGNIGGEIAYRKRITIPLSEKRLWQEGEGNLYDVEITYNGDKVTSYFGLREVKYDGYKFLLNGKETYQRLVLDQGFYPDGVYTAPTLEDMQKDIDLARELGFNGSRLHEKVFDPRFLYLCDKAGHLVWGEYPSWGCDYSKTNGLGQFLTEWEETVRRDFNHPSIITWCPLNEVWDDWEDVRKERDVRWVDIVYSFTKNLDNTRPCIDTSGGHHGKETDLYDFHCYESLEKLEGYLTAFEKDGVLDVPLLYNRNDNYRYQAGVAVNLSECGGVRFAKGEEIEETETVNEGAVQSEESWGYGKGTNNGDAFVSQYEALINLIYKYEKISGFCYTQLYDIEQEQNGFYCYDRSYKLTEKQKEKIKRINTFK